MKAVQIAYYGSEDALQIVEAPMPTPAPGQILVRIHAAGVNYYDIKIREGWLSGFFPLSFPHTLGNDFAGEVVELGADVTQFAVGDHVYGLITADQGGTYAEYLAVDAAIIRKMPANLSYLEAASLPMSALSALLAIRDLGSLQPGQTLLYHGGASGVGSHAIQMAKQIGATVIATCSASNMDYVRALGADVVIDYNATDFRTVANNVDVAVDAIGGETNTRTFEVMRRGGVMVVVLRNDPVEMANRDRLCQEYGVEVKILAFDLMPDGLDVLREMVEGGHLKPHVEHIYPLSEVVAAHELISGRHFAGRIVLDMDQA